METPSDVIAWSDMKGLFGGAEVGAGKVTRDVRANRIYYNNRDVTAQQILSGAVTNPNAKLLIDVLQLQQPPQPAQPPKN
jgi:lipid-binding SYLF domain-containing protein